ncbi:MAG: hypothetical protein LBG60_13985 [Bifidobacteriaceae bacterium]|nr:hypothetical protein [Bifidobacteriaceae bacterium]
MATIQLRNLPDDLHRRLGERARSKGVSMTKYLTDLLRRDLDRPTLEEWFEENDRRRAEFGTVSASVEELLADTRPVNR